MGDSNPDSSDNNIKIRAKEYDNPGENGFPENKIFDLKKEKLDVFLKLISRIMKDELNNKEANVIGMVNIHGSIVEDYITYFTS